MPRRAELKRVVGIDRIWRGSNDVAGYTKLGLLRDCLIARIERSTGLTLKEQMRWLKSHGSAEWATITWALAVRNAGLIHCMRYAPLRSRELVRLTRSMLRGTIRGVPCPIWTPGATVELTTPASVMKSHRSREGTFAAESDGPEVEQRFMRPLWALLLMPGGATEVLGGATDLIFVGGTPSKRLKAPGLSAAFRKEVLRYAHAPNIDPAALRSHDSAAGLHAVRALAGRYLAHDCGQVVQAMVMLHHASVEITIARYVGNSVRASRVAMPY